MLSGNVIIDETVSGGTYTIRGLSNLTDNSTGTAVVLTSGLLNPADISVSGGTGTCDYDEIALAVWNTLTSSGNTDGSFGVLLNDLINS